MSLKSRADLPDTYVFLFTLYRLSILSFSEKRRNALQALLFSVLWKQGRRSIVHREVCIQRPCHVGGAAGMPHLTLLLRLLFLRRVLTEDLLWARRVGGNFLSLTTTPFHPRDECRHKRRRQKAFIKYYRRALRATLRYSDLLWPRKTFYRALVEGGTSDPLSDTLGFSANELRCFWSWRQRRIISVNLSFR